MNQQNHANNSPMQQKSLEGTTLGDYLVGAGFMGNQDGIIADAHPLMAIDPMVMVSEQSNWLPLQMRMPTINQQQEQQQQQQQHMRGDFNVPKSEHEIIENSVVHIGYSQNPLTISIPMPTMSSTSSGSPAAADEKKPRFSDELLEKTIERRQKRMIKNRESAARSRARKQAYTNLLEDKKFRLQKTNNWLKKLKELGEKLFSVTTSLPRYQLRRTSSASF